MKNTKKIRKKSSKSRTWVSRVILFTSLVALIYGGFMQISSYLESSKSTSEVINVNTELSVPKKAEELDVFKIDFNQLQKENSEIVGYIVVADTDISFPVVQGSDNSFYLNHTFTRAENYAGAIFMDYRNNLDLTDYNTFIYGHNVKNGGMFSELSRYMEEGFFKKHPYVYYYTPDKSYKLQVYSAYDTNENSPISYRVDFSSKDDFQGYINDIKELSRFTADFKMNAEDKMVTLYTCSYEGSTNSEYIDSRYFIHTKVISVSSDDMPLQRK